MRQEISWWQLYLLLISSPLTALTTYSPVIITRSPPSRDMWIAVIMASVVSLIATLLVFVLAKRFEGMTVYEYLPVIFGKYLGFALSAALIVIFTYRCAVLLKQYGFFFNTSVYLRTPVPVFSILLAILGIIAVAEGFEFIGRIGEIAGLSLIAGIVFYLIFSSTLAEFNELRPVLAEGWDPVLDHMWTAIFMFGEAVVVSLLGIAHVNRLKQATKAIFLGWFTTLLFTVAAVVILMSVFGVDLLAILALPTLSTARLTSLGNIFERIEWIALLMWLGAMGVRVSIILYGCALGISTLFPKIKLAGASVIGGTAAMIWSFFIFERLSDIYAFFAPEKVFIQTSPLQIAPILFLIVAMIRGVKTTRDPQELGGPL